MTGATVARYLGERGISFALIGARAMALRGMLRSSLDTDFLTTDRTVLAAEFWSDLENATATVHRGDLTDPLAGVVRLVAANERVDVVVGKYKWQRAVIERAETVLDFPVVQTADLILLKLFAGGPQDLWDVHALLAADAAVVSTVDERIDDLPDDVRELWRGMRDLQ